MAKGVDFEEKSLEYLKNLFEQLGFPVTEARRQSAGTQNGFDIRIGFIDDTGRERKFYFECKDYTAGISWNDIAVKIHELYASSHEADGYIALSPHVNFSNINVNVLDKLVVTVRTPIKYWTPETNTREYFSVDTFFYESVYGAPATISETDKTAVLRKIRAVIIDMLRRKDGLVKQEPVPLLPKELTLKILRIHADDIIGREVELKHLHELLFNNGRVVVINGLGGIGKTTLAQGYISKYYKEYRHVAWITQLTDDITNDIVNAKGLTEKLSVDKQEKEVMQVCHEVLHKLKDIPDGPNLLILDNADERLVTLKDILPGQPHWHVLVTSREKVEGFYPKALDFLSPEQAITLFKKHCSFIKDEELMAELVKAIDYHTLTIEILAKTAQREKLNIEALKTSIQDDLASNVYVEHKGEKIDRVRSYLSSIFNLSELSEEEVWMMKQFTCLPTEFHAYGLLLQLVSPDDKRRGVFAETLNRLVEQGWLLHNEESDAYKMHVIVKEVAMRTLSITMEDVDGLLNKITGNLTIDQAKDNPVDKFLWIPYGTALLNNLPDGTASRIATLQNNLALVLQDIGDYAGARELLEKAVRSDEQNFGVDHPRTAISYSNLAMVLQDLGNYAGARELLEKAVAFAELHFGAAHPTTATSYSNLAVVLQDLGDYAGARELLEKAVRSDEQNFGVDHPRTATRYSNLALVLKKLGDYASARELLEKAVRSDKQNFGVDHPHTATSYSNLALVLKELGDYPNALELSGKSLAVFRKVLPEGHPHIKKVQDYYDLIKVKMEAL